MGGLAYGKENPERAKRGQPGLGPARRGGKGKRADAMAESIRELGLNPDDPLVAHFRSGTLADYARTPEGGAKFASFAQDTESLEHYLKLLKVAGHTGARTIAKFLRTREGRDAFVAIAGSDAGLKALARIGQAPEGQYVAKAMLWNPRGWGAIRDMLNALRDRRHAMGDRRADVSSMDLSPYFNDSQAAEKFASLVRDPKTAAAAFASLSETGENAELCKSVLKDPSAREEVFRHIVRNPEQVTGTFIELFKSADRRERMAGIFVSEGGTELLKDIASDRVGRSMLASLVIVPEGWNVGMAAIRASTMYSLAFKLAMRYFFSARTDGGEPIRKEEREDSHANVMRTKPPE